MSQNFRFRSDELEENDIGSDSRGIQNECVRNYDNDGQSRNINFILSNGDMVFRNYAYLVGGYCSLDGDQITLEFTDGLIELKGLNLKPLHYDLSFSRPQEIAPIDTRYNATMNQSLPIVNEVKKIK